MLAGWQLGGAAAATAEHEQDTLAPSGAAAAKCRTPQHAQRASTHLDHCLHQLVAGVAAVGCTAVCQSRAAGAQRRGDAAVFRQIFSRGGGRGGAAVCAEPLLAPLLAGRLRVRVGSAARGAGNWRRSSGLFGGPAPPTATGRRHRRSSGAGSLHALVTIVGGSKCVDGALSSARGESGSSGGSPEAQCCSEACLDAGGHSIGRSLLGFRRHRTRRSRWALGASVGEQTGALV